MKKPSLGIILFTVFLDLIGFGIVIPLLPIYSDEFGAGGLMIGWIMASYSLMQFLFSPIWGRLSDRVGRRPILLLSMAGSTISYGVFGVGSLIGGQLGLWILLGSRMFAGLFGANLTVAQAYIADVSSPDKRSQSMGLIGMAFGLGFILGPALGAFSAQFGIAVPGWVAAGLCGANFFLAVGILAESCSPTTEPTVSRPRWSQWAHTLGHPQLALLIGLFFLVTFAFTCFETTLGLLVKERFGYDRQHIGYLFAYAGIIAVVIQGGLMGRLVDRFGEPKLIIASLVIVGIGLAVLPYVASLLTLLVGLGFLAVGASTIRPPVFGLISNLSSVEEQGATLGVAQSAGSLARIVGPIFAGSLYAQNPAAPYLICAGVSLVAGVIACRWLPKTRQEAMNGVSSTLPYEEPEKSQR